MDYSKLQLVESLDLDLDLEGALGVSKAISDARGKFPFSGTFPFKGKYHIGYEQGLTLLKALIDGKAVKKEQAGLVLVKETVTRNSYENVAWKVTQEFEEKLKEIAGDEAEDTPIEGGSLESLEREIFG